MPQYRARESAANARSRSLASQPDGVRQITDHGSWPDFRPFESNMAKKKSKAFPWSKAGSDEIKKFTDYVEHCRHFAETIARRKDHPAVTEEDVADAIQEYAALWAGQCSKSIKLIKSAVPRKKKGSAAPLSGATEKRITELETFIREEKQVGDSGFGDPKARIAHWQNEIENLKGSSAQE
jgi:hypothetical protein